MSTQPRSDQWILRSRALLDRDAERLDPVLSRRLGMARRQALEALRPPLWRRWSFVAGLGGSLAAAASLLLVLGLPGYLQPGLSSDGGVPAIQAAQPALRVTTPIEQVLTLPEEDLELMSRPDDYALLDDLEFYAWMQGDGQDG